MPRSAQAQRIAVFDLDGTLAKTGPVNLGIITDVVQAHGVAFDLAQFRGFIQQGGPAAFFRAVCPHVAPERLWEEYNALELQRIDRIDAYADARPALLRARERGMHVATVTSRVRTTGMRLLRRLDLAPLVDFALFGDDLEHRKPHPECLLRTAEHFDASPAQLALVGDSQDDLLAAEAAGAHAVYIHRPESLRRLKPKHAPTVTSLLEFIDLLPRLAA